MKEKDDSQRPDNELAHLAAQGDMRAFELIYNRHHKRVYAVALRMTGNHAEAEDLAQECFLTLFSKIGSFRGHAAFVTWLYRLTVNQVLMYFRRRRARPEDQTPDGELPERAAGAPSPFPAIERIAIERAVNSLSPGYREHLVLHDVEGREHGEIARALGCTTGTSKSQLHRARLRLREMLAPTTTLLPA